MGFVNVIKVKPWIFSNCSSGSLRQSEFLKISTKFLWNVPFHRLQFTAILIASESPGGLLKTNPEPTPTPKIQLHTILLG